ncbi:hypothetical protein FOZ60_011335 [Perkinsus olseni]|uniref:Uncharacterized protein n=1 Tax=Perkinsus olseni TaxID=32597 RepID=A0A7J6NDV5_PEROL|nr:hypothetical protein FOZ60_011335 [Perkinsus olseni]
MSSLAASCLLLIIFLLIAATTILTSALWLASYKLITREGNTLSEKVSTVVASVASWYTKMAVLLRPTSRSVEVRGEGPAGKAAAASGSSTTVPSSGQDTGTCLAANVHKISSCLLRTGGDRCTINVEGAGLRLLLPPVGEDMQHGKKLSDACWQ